MAREPSEVARALKAFGAGLSDKPLGDYASTASNEAGGRGRQAGVTSVGEPSRIYASSVLDRNTCPACYGIDGKEYGSVADSLVDFPAGGYIGCDGGPRCRCTRVFVWPTEGTGGRDFPQGQTPNRPPSGGPGPEPAPPTPEPEPTGTPVDDIPAESGAPAPLRARTAKEAEAIARAHPTLSRTPSGKDRVIEYGGMDAEIANDINETYARLFELYPDAAERVNFIGTQAAFKRLHNVRLRGAGRAYMWAENTTGSIATLPKFAKAGGYEAITAELETLARTGWLAGIGVPAHAIAHEFGHHVYWELRAQAGFMDEVAAALGKALGAAPGEVTWSGYYVNLGPNGAELRKKWLKGLSTYSGTNPDELMAESFGEYVTNPNPRPIAQAIGEVIDKYLRRKP